MDTVVDGNFPHERYYESVFSKVIGCILSDGSRDDLYLRCRMKFLSNVVQTEAPPFVDLGIPSINTLNESGVLGTPVTRIRRPTDGSHCTTPDNFFGEETEVGMSAAKLDHEYIYKTDFEIWKENQEFGRQNISMSQPSLESTPIGTNTTNLTTSHLESTPIGKKMPDPNPLTRPTDYSKRKGECPY